MSKSQQQFKLEGKSYHAFPEIHLFIQEAGIDNATKKEKINLRFDQEGIVDVSQLFGFTRSNFIELGLSVKEASLLTKHLQRLRRRSQLILTTEELKEVEREYNYLSTGNPSLDTMLTYANQQVGLRSKTLVEFYGEAGIGKTQFLMTLAAMCIRSEQKSGWGKSVVYIDTEGSFELSRFYQIAAYYDVTQGEVDGKLEIAKAYNFDELDDILTILAMKLRHQDCGMIIIDSIIDPLKTQYPIDETMSNLQQRQQHLKQVCDQLKSMAQLHNLIVAFSNQVRVSMESDGSENVLVPQGGNVLAHATDLRFSIEDIEESKSDYYGKKDQLEKAGIKLATIKLMDCGFLPSGKVDLLVGPFGTANIDKWKENMRIVDKQKHLSVNEVSISGKKIDTENVKSKLYG